MFTDRNFINTDAKELSTNLTAGVSNKGAYIVTKSLTFTGSTTGAGNFVFYIPAKQASTVSGNTYITKGAKDDTKKPNITAGTENPTLTIAAASGQNVYHTTLTTNTTRNILVTPSRGENAVVWVDCRGNGSIDVVQSQGDISRATS